MQRLCNNHQELRTLWRFSFFLFAFPFAIRPLCAALWPGPALSVSCGFE